MSLKWGMRICKFLFPKVKMEGNKSTPNFTGDPMAIYHELGHGIIAYVFSGQYYTLKKITLKPEKKLDPRDLAYTICSPVEDIEEKVDANNHEAAALDGLLVLAGVAGRTLFSPDHNQVRVQISANNYESYFDLTGSGGDFDIIRSAERPYGWYLHIAGGMISKQVNIRHARLLDMLQELFLKEEIRSGVTILYDKLMQGSELTPASFAEVFDDQFVKATAKEMTEFIKNGLGKLILVD